MQDPVLTPIFMTGLVAAGLPEAGAAFTIGTVGITTANIANVLVQGTILAATIGASVAVNYAMQPDAPRPEQGTIPLRQTVPPRIVGFGEVRLAGNYVLYESLGSSSYDITALCQGPVGGFKSVFLDDTKVQLNPSTGGCITPGNPYQYLSAQVALTFGHSPNFAFSVPLPAIWTADHRGDGVCGLRLGCASGVQADFLKVYPHGLPKPSAAVFAPCWDFRDPAQDPDNRGTWINYSQWNASATYNTGARVRHGGLIAPGVDPGGGGMLYVCLLDGVTGLEPGPNVFHWAAVWKNPVLQVVTYLTNNDFGMGLPRDRIITPVLAELAAQAALCDEPVVKDDAGNYEQRYQSCPWFKMETNPSEVLALILAACDGWLSINGDGALSMRVGVFEPPTVTLDASMILSVELSYGTTDEEKVDEITLTYTSPEHNYTTQAIDSWRNEEAILTRGKVRSQAFGPASVQSATQVQRLAKRIMLASNAIRGTLTTHLGGMVAAGHRFVVIDYPLIPELHGVAVELRRRDTDLAARQCRFEFIAVDAELLDGWVPDEIGPPITVPPIVVPEPLPVPQNVFAAPDDGRAAVPHRHVVGRSRAARSGFRGALPADRGHLHACWSRARARANRPDAADDGNDRDSAEHSGDGAGTVDRADVHQRDHQRRARTSGDFPDQR